MPADSTHPTYDCCSDAWQMVRDCIAGSRKVKERGAEYLPRLYAQNETDYSAYKARATFFNALKRTLQAFVGFIFRNNPEFTVPQTPPMAAFMKDATMTGKSFYDVAKDTVGATLSVGKRGTIIDWQLIPENRAFLITYEAEDILSWKYRRVRGQMILSQLVLREYSHEWIDLKSGERPPDQYESKMYEQLRIYEVIDDEAGRPYVQVTVLRKKFSTPKGAKKNAAAVTAEFVIVDQKIPMRGAFALTRIPFVCHGPESNDLDSEEVPLESIADINISHYRTSADLENALHIAGVPTLFVAGLGTGGDEDEEDEIYLGSSKAIVASNANAKAELISYDASKAAPLLTAMERKEEQMAALGARMLEKQGGAGGNRQEAYQTVQVRQSGDHSALMSATIANSQSLSDVLQWVAWWNDRTVENPEDLSEDVLCELNTDFVQMAMEAPMLTALWTVYMAGGLSFDTLFALFQRGGIISSERKMEEEIAAIQNDPVRMAELQRQATADAEAAAAAAKSADASKAARQGKFRAKSGDVTVA